MYKKRNCSYTCITFCCEKAAVVLGIIHVWRLGRYITKRVSKLKGEVSTVLIYAPSSMTVSHPLNLVYDIFIVPVFVVLFFIRVRLNCGWTCLQWTCRPLVHLSKSHQGNRPRKTVFCRVYFPTMPCSSWVPNTHRQIQASAKIKNDLPCVCSSWKAILLPL